MWPLPWMPISPSSIQAGWTPGLFQAFHGAMVVGSMIGSLCRDNHYWQLLEIWQHLCRRSLDPASNEVWSIGPVVLDDGQLRAVAAAAEYASGTAVTPHVRAEA